MRINEDKLSNTLKCPKCMYNIMFKGRNSILRSKIIDKLSTLCIYAYYLQSNTINSTLF